MSDNFDEVVDFDEILNSISEKSLSLLGSQKENLIDDLENLIYIQSYLNDICLDLLVKNKT